jgi:hypothetical protein
MGEMRNAYRILVGKPEVKRPPGRPRFLKKCGGRVWVRSIWLRIGTSSGLFVNMMTLGSIKAGKFFTR